MKLFPCSNHLPPILLFIFLPLCSYVFVFVSFPPLQLLECNLLRYLFISHTNEMMQSTRSKHNMPSVQGDALPRNPMGFFSVKIRLPAIMSLRRAPELESLSTTSWFVSNLPYPDSFKYESICCVNDKPLPWE